MEHQLAGLNQIYNLLILSENLTTAGQPSDEELRLVARCGFNVVINLALADAEYALEDERGLVHSLGLAYEHIPVQWENPTDEDLSAFFQTMERYKHKKVFLHCAANKRVSVFVALYRISCLGWPEPLALKDVHRIWEPDPIWRDFLEKHKG